MFSFTVNLNPTNDELLIMKERLSTPSIPYKSLSNTQQPQVSKIYMVREKMHWKLRQHYLQNYKQSIRSEVLIKEINLHKLYQIEEILKLEEFDCLFLENAVQTCINLLDTHIEFISNLKLLERLIIALAPYIQQNSSNCDIIVRVLEECLIFYQKGKYFEELLMNSVPMLWIFLNSKQDIDTFIKICRLLSELYLQEFCCEYEIELPSLMQQQKIQIKQLLQLLYSIAKKTSLDTKSEQIIKFFENAYEIYPIQTLTIFQQVEFLPQAIISMLKNNIQKGDLDYLLLRTTLKILYSQMVFSVQDVQYIVGQQQASKIQQQVDNY